MLTGKNIAVTGGAGFIGSHIVEALYKQNNVVVIDNLFTGLEDNVKPFKNDVKFENVSITDAKAIESALKGIDIIFHEGANVQIPRSIENPQFDAETNIIGTINVLEAARKNDISTVVFAASSSVYGNPVEIPIKETHRLMPLSPYAAGKRACEDYMRLYNEMYGIKTVCLRYFNVYGPRQRSDSPYSGVISIFSDKLKRGEKLVVYGDGEQSRDFVNVKDVAQANILAAESGKSGIYNVGTGKEISLNDLIKTMEEIIGKKAEIEYTDERPGDIRRSVADITKIKEELGFEPKISLEEGLRELLDKQ
ncbi:MAG: SDR family oxidoreductase [Candidatus Micrarchaeota archaeon]|nr:SDR family oxidoreductase [Candidatus Micrarchaeota archaeon]